MEELVTYGIIETVSKWSVAEQIIVFATVWNAIVFLFFGLDKICAKNHWNRVSEIVLIALALLGGSIGALAGIVGFHHKTKKKKFRIAVPCFLLLHIFIIYLYALRCRYVL